MLTLSSVLQTHPASSPSSASVARLSFFYVALYLLALAQGFQRPCAETLGANQFAPTSDGEPGALSSRSSYFNWFHFYISWGYAIATAALSYIEDNVGWTAGFGVCWATMMVCFAVFLIGARTYRAERPVDGNPFLDAVRAWAARVVLRRKDAKAGTELSTRHPLRNPLSCGANPHTHTLSLSLSAS
jgi:solute carrier family 15 (peptide/histidine transporter), member 3/4